MSEEVKGFINCLESYLIFSSRRLFVLYPGWVGAPLWFLRIEKDAYDKTTAQNQHHSLDSFLKYLIERGGDPKNMLDALESKNILDVLGYMMSRKKESFEIPYGEITRVEIKKSLFTSFIVVNTKTKEYIFRFQPNALLENHAELLHLVLRDKLIK